MAELNLEPPILTSTQSLLEIGIASLKETYPNFEPNPAEPFYQWLKSFAAICSQTLTLGYNVPEEILKFVGEEIYQTVAYPAIRATVTSTWEALDTNGPYEIPAGAQVTAQTANGEQAGFEVRTAVIIPNGSTVTSTGGVELLAVEAGEQSNGASGEGASAESLFFVKKITLVASSTGGEEAETTGHYLRRVYELARLVKPQPILPEDFANYVRLKVPGVFRAVAIDLLELEENYSNKVGAENKERCVCVVPLTEAGVSPAKSVLELAYTELVGAREASFKNFIGLPTTKEIELKVVGKSFKGFNNETVKAGVESALELLINPALWGTTGSNLISWTNKRKLRYRDVVTAINNVEGFNFETELKLNGAEVDVELPGIAPLPKKKSISVTITTGEE